MISKCVFSLIILSLSYDNDVTLIKTIDVLIGPKFTRAFLCLQFTKIDPNPVSFFNKCNQNLINIDHLMMFIVSGFVNTEHYYNYTGFLILVFF